MEKTRYNARVIRIAFYPFIIIAFFQKKKINRLDGEFQNENVVRTNSVNELNFSEGGGRSEDEESTRIQSLTCNFNKEHGYCFCGRYNK